VTAQASRPVAVPAEAVTRLEPLVGRWDWTGASTDKSLEVAGWAEFSWLDGKHFLVERFELRSAGVATSGIAVIGPDDTGRLRLIIRTARTCANR
jgi:hypothetical protein